MGILNLSTEKKFIIASWISRILVGVRGLFGLPPTVQVERSGVLWGLDLREGIDLAVYLGVYEPETLKALKRLVKEGDLVLDIGANVGAIALSLAQYVGISGKVIAFEPTAWACRKLEKNVALNPHLSSRVKIEQIMLLDREREAPSMVYSSWNLRAKEDSLTHPQHKGKLRETEGVQGISLDRYFQGNPVPKIDLIKLDVDGYELTILQGARKTLMQYRPAIVLEIAPYVQEEKLQFAALLEELQTAGYELRDLTLGKKIPLNQADLESLCPPGGGLNVLAVPEKLSIKPSSRTTAKINYEY